jgi:hypothetical protein
MVVAHHAPTLRRSRRLPAAPSLPGSHVIATRVEGEPSSRQIERPDRGVLRGGRDRRPVDRVRPSAERDVDVHPRPLGRSRRRVRSPCRRWCGRTSEPRSRGRRHRVPRCPRTCRSRTSTRPGTRRRRARRRRRRAGAKSRESSELPRNPSQNAVRFYSSSTTSDGCDVVVTNPWDSAWPRDISVHIVTASRR